MFRDIEICELAPRQMASAAETGGSRPAAGPPGQEAPAEAGGARPATALEKAWAAVEAQLAQWQQQESAYWQAVAEVEAKVAQWQFEEAVKLAQGIRFSQPELAERWQVRQQQLQWLAEWKERLIARIGAARPPLRKSDLSLRGIGGEIVAADREKITCRLIGGKTESLAWSQLGPQAARKMVALLLQGESAEELLKAAVFLASVGQPAEAARYFAQAQEKGLPVQPHLELASFPMVRELVEQLRKKEYSAARSALDRLEKEPALAPSAANTRSFWKCPIGAGRGPARGRRPAENSSTEAVQPLGKAQELHDGETAAGEKAER